MTNSGEPEAARGILDVRGLTVTYRSHEGTVPAVRGIDLHAARGEIVGILGESGSGKSSAAAAIMGLIPSPPGRVTADRLAFEGVDLATASKASMRSLRGRRVSMIFQNPTASLNPALTVGYQLREMFKVHTSLSKAEIRERSEALLSRVGIPNPRERLEAYPHEFSGGMSQRVMIALAIALEPGLLLADEPTTALDVTIQAQIIELLDDLRAETGMTIILISHNLALLANVAQRVVVMYAGRVVEHGPTDEVLRRPSHPYTRGLIASIPRIADPRPLQPIGGLPPNPALLPSGCSFRSRCPQAQARCAEFDPRLEPRSQDHAVACHFPVSYDRTSIDVGRVTHG